MAEADAADRAEAHFRDHYNCAQAVLWGVAETRGLMREGCIPAIALAMGGGVGHTGGVCGAVTGAALAIGLAVEEVTPADIRGRRDAANRVVGPMVHRFEAEFGTADCRALLGFSWEDADADARYRREGAKEAICLPCIRWAAAEAVRLIDEVRGAL